MFSHSKKLYLLNGKVERGNLRVVGKEGSNKLFLKKKEKGSNALNGINRMEPNRLIPDCDCSNNLKYLNVSVELINGRAEMAEWSTQSVDTRYPSGCVGSIPTLGAANFEKVRRLKNEF